MNRATVSKTSKGPWRLSFYFSSLRRPNNRNILKSSPSRSREDSLSQGSERGRLATRRKKKKRKGGSWRVPREGWPHGGSFLFCGRSSPRIPFTMDNGVVPEGRISSHPRATGIVNDPWNAAACVFSFPRNFFFECVILQYASLTILHYLYFTIKKMDLKLG